MCPTCLFAILLQYGNDLFLYMDSTTTLTNCAFSNEVYAQSGIQLLRLNYPSSKGSAKWVIQTPSPSVQLGCSDSNEIESVAFSDLTVPWADSFPDECLASSDRCATLNQKGCGRKWARKTLFCRWDSKKKLCSVKQGKTQPKTPAAVKSCDDPGNVDICCTLDKRACKGRGFRAKAWEKKHNKSPKKNCKFVTDPLRLFTPDVFPRKKKRFPNYGKCVSRQ